MNTVHTVSFLALGIVLGSRSAEAQPATFEVLPDESSTVVDVHKSGVLSPALHDHHFHVEKWSGSFTFDPEHLETVHGEVVFEAASLRDKQPELSAADEQKVNRQVHGPEILDAARYPTIRLSFDRLEILERGNGTVRGRLVGSLTLHGQTRPIRVPMAASFRADRLHAVGATAFKVSDFGIKPPSKALGAIGVADRLDVHFDLAAAVKPANSP
ncbi:MAG: YceI family protein [Polyangiaceae bacterium]